MKEEKMLLNTEVGFLLIPPVLNYFNQKNNSNVNYFLSPEEVIFDLKNNLENWKKSPEKESLFQFISNLSSLVDNRHISQLLSDSEKKKIIFINYPLKEEGLITIEEGIKISKIRRLPVVHHIFFSKPLEKIFLEYKNERLFCPICGTNHWKKKVISEEIFKCLDCKTVLSKIDAEQFNQDFSDFYFKNLFNTLEYYKKRGYKLNFIELIMKEDFSPEILKKYLIEKI